MVKTRLNMEQLVAGALLFNFDKISSLDISLLAEDFLRDNSDYEFKEFEPNYLKKYIKIEDGFISLKDGLKLDSYISSNGTDLRKRLMEIAGSRIRKYFEKFDLEEFVLRKIRKYSSVDEDCVNDLFCKVQREELKRLDEKGYLTTVWNDDVPHDDYREIRLSDRGKLVLFKKDYAKELDRFTQELKSLRYDISMIDDYLLTQDLDDSIWVILDVRGINRFCQIYDRCELENGASHINFNKLKSDKSSILDSDGKSLMQDMLSVWDDDHCIYICHPNHLFAGAKPITRDVREMVNINWDDIDIERMIRINNYKTFLTPDCSEAFKYVHNHLGYQIMSEIRKGNEDMAVSYLAVVERYTFNYEDNYLVRGIIRGDSEGYSLAFNPEYQKAIPQSVWDKSLRFSGHEVPSVYLLKRKK